MDISTYRLIMPLPPKYGRDRLYFALMPDFVSGLSDEELIAAFDPLFCRPPVPVRTEAYTGKNKPWKLQATGISHDCTELNLLHHRAYACVAEIRARPMKQHLCGEHFDPFIAVRDGIRCPVNVEFACDRVVLTEFGSTFSWKDPVKTWHLR